jgi:hypothetical protein
MIADDKHLKGSHVVLTKDLTRYNKALIKGAMGTTVGKATQAFYNDGYNSRFVKVKFPTITIDILWDGLELVKDLENAGVV